MTPLLPPDRKPLDVFREVIAKGEQPVPLANLLGFRAVEVDAGRCVMELDAGEEHGNIIGTLHGGVLAAVADSAMGVAFAATLEAGERCTTVELRINFLRPFDKGRIRAVAQVVRRGRNLGYLECDLLDAAGQLLARSSSTYMVLR
jgi:uncharacterized protein (TIGR00369 family)